LIHSVLHSPVLKCTFEFRQQTSDTAFVNNFAAGKSLPYCHLDSYKHLKCWHSKQ